MCPPAVIVLGLYEEEKLGLIAGHLANFFGVRTVRLPIIRKFQREKYFEAAGHYEGAGDSGAPRWQTTSCGERVGKFLWDLQEQPILRDTLIEEYEESRKSCQYYKPPKQRPTWLEDRFRELNEE